MYNILARIISIIFQPIFIPLYGAVLLSFADPTLNVLPLNLKAYIWLIVFFSTGLIPALIIGICMKFGTVSDGFISKRQERPIPFILTFLGYLLCTILLNKAGLPLFHIAPIFGAALSLLIVIIVSFFWKISAHLTAAGGFCGGVFAFSLLSVNQYPVILIVAVVLSGLIGWSRMVLKAHSIEQVCLGWLNGFICVTFSWLLIPLFAL